MTDLIISDETLTREKWISVTILVLLPLPCVANAILQARAGHTHWAWVFLALAVLLEILAAVDRALLMRGFATLALALRHGGIELRWTSETRIVREEDILDGGIVRGFITGRPVSFWLKTPMETYRLPWYSGAEELLQRLLKGNDVSSGRRPFPILPFVGILGLGIVTLANFVLKVPPVWLGPVLSLALASVFAAYPLHPVLGPGYRRWDLL
ncbi:MAG: hypothetical protein ACYTFG_02055, partial [Planctomycetota bacterium]